MLVTRWITVALVTTALLVACAPAAPPSPTAAPAPPKPAATAAPAKPTEAPAAKPAATAAPKAEAKPTEKPAAKAEAKPASAYYAGKTITLLAGSSPGGGTDTIVRLVARHLGRFIPGRPNIIVQNVDGGGGMIALNQMVNQAKPDGLTFNGSISQTLLYAQLQGTQQVRYDLRTLTWIGSAFDDTQVLWVRSATPYTDIEALRKAPEPPKLGAQSGTHSSVILPKVVQEVTGLKFNVVTGYPGSPEIFLDVERGALDGRFASFGSLKTQRPEWVQNKFIRFLIFSGDKRHPELPDVPSITELIPPDKKVLQALVFAPQQANRAMAGPPGIPPEIAKIVQDAYAQMYQDKEFQADMEKTGFEPGYTSPQDLLKSVEGLLGNEEMKATLDRILKG